jgi:hypothetical protein
MQVKAFSTLYNKTRYQGHVLSAIIHKMAMSLEALLAIALVRATGKRRACPSNDSN